MSALSFGLQLFHIVHPSVSIEVMPSGETVMGFCGDEHFKRCITGLQNLCARGTALTISLQLVAVRESFAESVEVECFDPEKSALRSPTWSAHLQETSTEGSSTFSGYDEIVPETSPQERFTMSETVVMDVWAPNRQVCLSVAAVAMPESVSSWMDVNADELDCVLHRQRASPAFAESGADKTSAVRARTVPALPVIMERVVGNVLF